jgi:hypothetical protein
MQQMSERMQEPWAGQELTAFLFLKTLEARRW